MPHKAPTPPAFIFRPRITLPSGRVLYAKDYGLKAFKISLRDRLRRRKKLTFRR
jgi:hypothetical protein